MISVKPSLLSLLSFMALLVAAGCSSSSSGTSAGTDGGVGSGADGAGGSSGFAGVYNATFAGTFQNTSPNTESGSSMSSATITVSTLSSTEVELSWQVPPNPPSGTAIFVMSGSNGTLADAGATSPQDAGGTAVGGSCFTGDVNGNTQTNCCTSCTVSFTSGAFSQPNSGIYTGTTPEGVAYTGTYTGVWTGTLQ